MAYPMGDSDLSVDLDMGVIIGFNAQLLRPLSALINSEIHV